MDSQHFYVHFIKVSMAHVCRVSGIAPTFRVRKFLSGQVDARDLTDICMRLRFIFASPNRARTSNRW